MSGLQRNYQQLARLYDLLMEGVDYQGWVTYVEQLVRKFGGQVSRVADLACGTGSSTLPWASRGFRTCGVDLSAEMLEIAGRKAAAQGLEIDFRQQDLCRLDLAAPDLAVCFQDGLNYITDPQALQQALRSVYNNLAGGGFFVFDLNYLPRLVADSSEPFSWQEERFALTWSARMLEDDLWSIELRGCLPDCQQELHERHSERIYDLVQVWQWLAATGFTVEGSYRAFTMDPPDQQTIRTVCVARKTCPPGRIEGVQ